MLTEAVRLALQAILRNALRSFLTVLGIVIGVAAVIAMVTIGHGTTAQVTADVAKLGTNLLLVLPGQSMRGPGRAAETAQAFAIEDAEAVADQVGSIRAVAPSSAKQVTAIFGNQNWSTTLTGTDAQYQVVRDWNTAQGRGFNASEIQTGKTVCILGETVRRELFGSLSPLGDTIRIGRVSCGVIGVLEAKGVSSFGRDQDDLVLMPLRAFQRRVSGNADVGTINVSVREGVSTEKVTADIERLMRERRHIVAGEDDDFHVLDTKELASMLTGITSMLTGLLGAVAAVSLLVGGVGIMNIMLVSVTERTREIGIRLAIGALERQVLAQFLVEAVVLSLIGGIIGILSGLALAGFAARLLKVPFVFDPTIVAIAFAFSAAVGVVFGYFPARRAARMDPIEALRHE